LSHCVVRITLGRRCGSSVTSQYWVQAADRMYIQCNVPTASANVAVSEDRPQGGWPIVLEGMYYAARFGESNGTL
jgi:hypothetical protein